MPRSDAPTRIRLLTGLILLLTFAAGVAVGAGIDRFLRPPHHPPPPMLRLPLGELDLTPEQEARARAIADSHRAELETILRGTFPRVRAIHERVDAEVRAILTPEQQRRFDELRARRPHRPPPGMPAEGLPDLPPPPPPPPRPPD